jgi:hypothetical protein
MEQGRGPLKVASSLLVVGSCLALGCAHAGAASEADEEAAVAEGVRAAIRLYSPGKEPPAGPYCVEVDGSPAFERGVVAVLDGMGLDAVPMPACPREGKNAVLWVKVQSFEWTDWVTRTQLDVHGTVETRPEEHGAFRLGWWRATFHASLGYRDGRWTTLAADDLGRI